MSWTDPAEVVIAARDMLIAVRERDDGRELAVKLYASIERADLGRALTISMQAQELLAGEPEP